MAHLETYGPAPDRRQLVSEAKVTFRDPKARLRFHEQSRRKSEAVYRKDPSDVANLTRWGEALLELAEHKEYLNDRVTLVQDAILILEGALAISPSSHQTVSFLGGAYTAAAFLTPDDKDANIFFEKASQCFQKAVDLDPNNIDYTESLELCPRAPFARASCLGRIIRYCASVGRQLKVPEQQAEIQTDMGSNQHISSGHVKVPEQRTEIQSDMGYNQHISIGHVKVPEQQAEIQSDMGSVQHISVGHVKVPEQQTEIQSDMGCNQHISIGHVKDMLENLAVTDMMI